MELKTFVALHLYSIIDYTVLVVVLAVCVPLLVVVPDSRPYGATLIAWAAAFALHLWRWLPWEKTHVRRTAHRRADRRMQACGVGRLHHHASALRLTRAATSSATWSLPRGRGGACEGNWLPKGEWDGDEEDSYAWGLVPPLQRKFLQDSRDTTATTSSLRLLCPRLPREMGAPTLGDREGAEEGRTQAALLAPQTHRTTTPALMLQQRASPSPTPQYISAAALESSSQFLALSASASPTRPSASPEPPQQGDPQHASAEMRGVEGDHSHEPFTHASRRLSSSVADSVSSLLASPPLSPIANVDLFSSTPAGGRAGHEASDSDTILVHSSTAEAATFPSLSPASSRRTHGYVPHTASEVETEVAGAVASVSGSTTNSLDTPLPSPSRISVISSNVQCRGAFSLVQRGAFHDG